MIITYQAVDDKGQASSATLEAGNAREAVEQLRSRGLFVTHVEEASESGAGLRASTKENQRASVNAGLSRRSREPRLPLTVLVIFTRQMTMLLRAGSALVPAIMAIKRQTKKPDQAAILKDIIEDLEDGSGLADALRKHPRTFNSLYCAVIAAGEASGNLSGMFERLATMVVKHRALRNKVLGALAYPVLLIAMSCSILSSLFFFVIPRFSEMFTQLGVDPPATTKVMLSIADTLREYWFVIPLALLSIVGVIIWIVMSDAGRQWMADMQLSIPIVGRLRARLIEGQVLRTIGTLLDNGVGLLETLGLARRSTRSRKFQTLFDELEESVTSGGRLSTAFECSGLVEPYVCQAVHTGEESGSLGPALTYCADIVDEANAELVGTVMKLLEPVILIGMGIVVGTVAVSLFMPLFDLTAAMQ